MFRKLLSGCVLIFAAGCSTFHGTPPAAPQAALPDHYVVFFAPRTAQLASEAQAIVRRAAEAVQERKPSKIEIAVPPKVPGGPDVVEGRYTAIQNIIASTGADPNLYSRVVLLPDGINLPGGSDRAEIWLIP
jgi:hypothetical protein